MVATYSPAREVLRRQLPREQNPSKKKSSDREAQLSQFCHDYVDVGMPGLAHCIRHPGKCLSAFVAVHRIPSLRADPADGVEGSAIRDELLRGSAIRRRIFPAMAVLTLPRHPGQYELGPSKQTLRRKIRQAQRLGVRWATVDEPEERRKLLELATEWERNHPVDCYRNPDPQLSPLLSYGLWLAAYSAAGRPLLLSVTPVDGEWALLRYFRTLTAGEEASSARYLMTRVLVEHVVRLGARYLIDQSSPLWLSNGLRHYQRMLGFRLVRLHLAPRGRSWPRESHSAQQPQPALVC